MRIKFPGKSDEEADYLLDKVNMRDACIGLVYYKYLILVLFLEVTFE